MSKFLTKLQTEEVGSRLWKLTSPLIYSSDLTGTTFEVPVDFQTDFMSTWGIPFISLISDGEACSSGALHDWLYTNHALSRSLCDDILAEACLVQGLSRWKIWLIWAGVRLGGWRHW